MTPALALDWASLIAMVLLGLAMLVAVVRIVLGPTLGDRVLALDLLTVLAMGFIAAFAIRSAQMLYLDIAIAIALMGFLATIALSRYIMSRAMTSKSESS